MTLKQFVESKDKQGYFLHEFEINQLIALDRFAMCLVRTGMGRFVTPVQNLKHFVKVIDKSEIDYIRDISLESNYVEKVLAS